MIEIMVLFGLGAVALVAVAFFAVIGLLFKAVFKVALLPITLGFGLVKILLVGLVGVVAIVIAPVLFVSLLLIGLPLLVLGCILGCCAWAFAAAV